MEGTRNYVTFVMKNKKILSLMTMKEIERILPKNEFIRIHKSFIVSLSFIEKIKDNHVLLGENSYPISATYKNELLKRLNL